MLPAENCSESWSLKAPKAAATKQWFFSANLQCGCCLTDHSSKIWPTPRDLYLSHPFSIFLLAPQNNSRTIIAWMPLHKGWQRMAFPQNSRISKATLSFAAGLPEMDAHIFRSIFRFQRTISPAPARPANDRKALCRMWAKKIQKCGKPHSDRFIWPKFGFMKSTVHLVQLPGRFRFSRDKRHGRPAGGTWRSCRMMVSPQAVDWHSKMEKFWFQD